MALNISLSPPVETKLRKRAAEVGKDAAAFASQLIEQAISRPTLDEILAPVRAEFAASGMTEDEMGDLLEVAKHDLRRECRQAAVLNQIASPIAFFNSFGIGCSNAIRLPVRG